MAKLSRSLLALAVLLGVGGTAYLTRDKWQNQAPQWVRNLLPPVNAARPQQQADASGGARRATGGNRRGGPVDASPIPVLTASAVAADVPVTIDGVGTVKALNSVTITAQVTGQIVDLPFKEGQDVRKGDIIARIDDSTYKAAYDQAVAKRAQDQAQLDNARLDLQRYIGLVANNSVTKQTADTQKATVAQNEALVKADEAAIASAKATLDYTVITAPIDGRLGIRNVDIGNVVQASSSTGIVTLSQIKPISVFFNVPQQYLQQIAKAKAGGELQVMALAGDNTTIVDTGTLDVIDNQVDSTTGTIRLKAVFPNEAEALWPGAFVNARLQVQIIRNAIVIPTAALQRGPSGPFLYILGADGKARMRPVTVGQQGDAQTVITSGIKLGEQVITTGFARLSDGAKVEVSASGATSATDGNGLGAGPSSKSTADNTQPQSPQPEQNGEGPRSGKHRRSEGTQGSASPATGTSPTPDSTRQGQ